MIYFVQEGKEGPIKIGYTQNSEHVEARIQTMQVGNTNPLRLLGILEGDTYKERWLHGIFANEWVSGEWFKPSDNLLAAINDPAVIELLYEAESEADKLATQKSGNHSPGTDWERFYFRLKDAYRNLEKEYKCVSDLSRRQEELLNKGPHGVITGWVRCKKCGKLTNIRDGWVQLHFDPESWPD